VRNTLLSLRAVIAVLLVALVNVRRVIRMHALEAFASGPPLLLLLQQTERLTGALDAAVYNGSCVLRHRCLHADPLAHSRRAADTAAILRAISGANVTIGDLRK
jgi:hypothetical protein